MFPFSFRSSASQASSESATVQPNRSLVPLPLRSKSTPSAAPVSAIPSPFTSMITGDPPIHLQVRKSKSPSSIKHLLIAVALQELVVEKQHSPVPFGLLPGGQLPSKPGVVQFAPADPSQSLQLFVTECALFHKLPPVAVAPPPIPADAET